MTNKKNVLIIAYACEPNETSEPGVGWNFSQEISKFMNVTLITRTNNRTNIESDPNSKNIQFIYYDLPNYVKRLKKAIPFGLQLYYLFWQFGAYLKVRQLTNRGKKKFDLIHHLTFGMIKMTPPAFIIKLPFVWGPIGGGDKIPFIFLKGYGFKAHMNEIIYRALHKASNLSPFSYLTRKTSNAIIFRNLSVRGNFPVNGCPNRYIFSETATNIKVKALTDKRVEGKFNILCIGRMIQSKGYIHALEGFNKYIDNGGNGSLVFLGKGPEEKSLKSFVKKHKLESKVTFRGFVSNDEVIAELKQSDVFLQPSFREGGSWSIMEAMMYGLPVICLDTSGPKDMVTDQCGLLINMSSPEQVRTDIAAGLSDLANDHKLYQKLSKNAKERIKAEYNWNKRREQIKEVYKEVLGSL
jgi:glycosyltransferase involved in cell wall biosynthesis